MKVSSGATLLGGKLGNGKLTKVNLGAALRGGATEEQPPFLTKVIFVNRLKPMWKNWEYGGWRHQPHLNFSLSLSQVVFKDRIYYHLYFIQLLT